MRFPRIMVVSKDKMEQKAGEKDAIIAAALHQQQQADSSHPTAGAAAAADIVNGVNDDGALPAAARKVGVVGLAPLIIMSGATNGSRRVSNAESMSCSSQDSFGCCADDEADLMRLKRLSSETGSMSVASTTSSSDTGVLDELDDLLLGMQGQLVECHARREDIKAYESSYRECKALVREMAQELVMKIRAHEARLLEEIEAQRDTMYKRLGHGREKLDKQIKKMEKMCSEGEAIAAQANQMGQPPELCPEYQEVVDKLRQGLEAEDLQVQHPDVKVLPICLSPVRCNTAFACLDNHQPGGGTSSKSGHMRRKSVMYSPTKPRCRTGSLQASSSVAHNIHHLGVNDTPGRRYSLQQPHHHPVHLSPSLQHNWRHGGSTSSRQQQQQQQACLSEGYEDSSRTQLLWEVTDEGPSHGQINCPNDICFLHNGHLVVSDRDNLRLQVFDEHGKVVRLIAEGKIKPRRIAITREGNIAVTDSKDNVVKVFDTEGNQVSSWGKKRFKQMFKSPCGIACNSRGQFIVSDMERHTVTIHNSEGKLLRHLGGEGGGIMEFHSPSYIAINAKNQIIVSDNWNHSVQVFDEQGNFLHHVDCNNDLKYPNGITCATDGHFYVALWGSHGVAQFSQDGKFAGQVLCRGENSLYHPAGVAVHNNVLAVSEYSDTHSAVRFYAINNNQC